MLDDAAIERYARQIIVPGIGAAGQEKLLNSTVLVVGNPRGCATASLYLRAAGVRVLRDVGLSVPPADLAMVCDASRLSVPRRLDLLESKIRICWYNIGALGFTSGVHPHSTLPTTSPATSGCGIAIHDAAACDSAATACALLANLLPTIDLASFDVE